MKGTVRVPLDAAGRKCRAEGVVLPDHPVPVYHEGAEGTLAGCVGVAELRFDAGTLLADLTLNDVRFPLPSCRDVLYPAAGGPAETRLTPDGEVVWSFDVRHVGLSVTRPASDQAATLGEQGVR